MKNINNIKLGYIPQGLTFTSNNPDISHIENLVHYTFVPTFGISRDITDALSVLADAQYTFVRHFNSGSRNYQASDLMMYELATTSLWLLVAWARKTLGLVKCYSKENRARVKLLAYANCIDLNDWQRNYQDAVAYVNILIDRLAAYVIPGDMEIIPRWFGLTEKVFIDDYEEGQTAQYFDFCPSFIYKYDTANGYLEPKFLKDYITSGSDNGLSFKDFEDMCNDLIAPLIGLSDIGTMSGDILKAYKDNVYKLSNISADIQLEFVRVTNEFIAYIMNADLILDPYYLKTEWAQGVRVLNTYRLNQNTSTGVIEFAPVVGLHDPFTVNAGTSTPGTYEQDLLDNCQTELINYFNKILHGDERMLNYMSTEVTDSELIESIRGKIAYPAFTLNNIETRSGMSGGFKCYITPDAVGSEMLCAPVVLRFDSNPGSTSVTTGQYTGVHYLWTAPYHMSCAYAMSSTGDANYIAALAGYSMLLEHAAHSQSVASQFAYGLTLHFINFRPNDMSDPDDYIFHYDTDVAIYNVKFLPNSTIKYALIDDNWDNIVNELWLKRSK